MFHYLWKMQLRRVVPLSPFSSATNAQIIWGGQIFARLKEVLQLNCSLKMVSTTIFALAKKLSSECLIFPKSIGKKIYVHWSSFHPRFYFLIANVDKNLGEIVIEEVWSKTCNQNLKRKRQVQSWSKSKTPPKKMNLNDSKTIFTCGTKSWTKTQ